MSPFLLSCPYHSRHSPLSILIPDLQTQVGPIGVDPCTSSKNCLSPVLSSSPFLNFFPMSISAAYLSCTHLTLSSLSIFLPPSFPLSIHPTPSSIVLIDFHQSASFLLPFFFLHVSLAASFLLCRSNLSLVLCSI